MQAEHNSPRVAVIAVHGVADQEPCVSARAAADLLAHAQTVSSQVIPREQVGADDDEGIKPGRYQAFEESELRILVNRVLPSGEELSLSGSRFPEARPRAFSWRQQSQAAASQIDGQAYRDEDDLSHEYMVEQLSQHVVAESDAVFETIRLDSVRTGSAARVAVFELYWADLSRFVGSWVRWLIEFYQLLFFLCSLGRKSLDFARARYERRPGTKSRLAWRLFGWCQIVTEQALVLFVPVVNLYLLGIASCVLPLLLPKHWILPVIVGELALAATLAGGFFIYWKRRKLAPGGRSWPWWVLGLLAILSGAIGLGLGTAEAISQRSYLWLEFGWWILPVAAITFMMAKFQKSRPGALPAGVLVGAAVSVIFVVQMCRRHSSPETVMDGILGVADCAMLGLQLSWIAVLLGAFGATMSAFDAVIAVRHLGSVEQDKARRAAWTANLTLVLPALVVLILNITLWQTILTLAVPEKPRPERAVAETTEKTPEPEESKSPFAFIKHSKLWNAPYTPIFHRGTHPEVKAGDPASVAAQKFMAQAYSPFYWLHCALFAAAALLLAWSIVPALIAELRLDEQKDQTPDQRQSDSGWLGESLSAGFRAMRLSGEIVRIAVIAVLPIGIIFTGLAPYLSTFSWGKELEHFPFYWMATANYAFLWVGAWLVAALILARGPFRGIALGLRLGLDVALDVINWLRLHPLESNGRARICARYQALLRHIEEWKDPNDGSGFKAIVILAHSQGTVITADLLRFLNHRSNRVLAPKLPIYLFTMGNPLRQLYSLRFPHLYSWARHTGSTWAGDEPAPTALGVKRWVNAYRSGDYVGRYLWHPDAFGGPHNAIWSTKHVHVDGGASKREFCIGSGAHTHYWDETAPEIALELDRLVGLAAAS